MKQFSVSSIQSLLMSKFLDMQCNLRNLAALQNIFMDFRIAVPSNFHGQFTPPRCILVILYFFGWYLSGSAPPPWTPTPSQVVQSMVTFVALRLNGPGKGGKHIWDTESELEGGVLCLNGSTCVRCPLSVVHSPLVLHGGHIIWNMHCSVDSWRRW